MFKNVLSVLTAMFFVVTTFAQVAPDFTATDCNGNSHNLYAELNSGKIIVMVWVEPCSSCVGPSLTTYNVVNSYKTSHPNTVYMYLCDDIGNTNCTSLSSWKSSNGISSTNTFSDAKIIESNYGALGMPKIVVLGGASHTVFYNVNNTVDPTALQAAINSALLTAGINEQGSPISSLSIYPNPASIEAEIKFTLAKTEEIKLDLFDLQGKLLKNIFTGNLSAGQNKIRLNYSDVNSGVYLLRLSDGDRSKFINVVVAH